MTQNPTQIGKPAAVSGAKKDEPWIRDAGGQGVSFDFKDEETLARCCEGISIHCQNCGEKFPLWPPKLLAGHCLEAHAAELTMQQLAGMGALCADECGPVQLNYISTFLLILVELRRRARDLGLAVFEKPSSDGPQLVDPRGQRLQ